MSKPKTYGLTHLAIAVKDVDRTMRFYKKVFEMETMYYQEGFLQLCTPGCNDILVFEKKESNEIGKSGGIAHFGFRLTEPDHINEIINKVLEAGGEIIDQGEFVKGSPYVFFKDPDGYEVEVWYEMINSEKQ